MKHFGLDWGAFLGGLEGWERLSPPARGLFLDLFRPNLPVPTTALGKSSSELVRSGLVTPIAKGNQLKLADPFRSLLTGLRAMEPLPLFEEASAPPLEIYLDLHFSMVECEALVGREGPHGLYSAVVARVTSVDWLESVRQAPNLVKWEKKHTGPFEAHCFADPAVAPALHTLLDHLIEQGGPSTFGDLLRALPGLPRPVLGKALYAGIRYLLLFPALRPADLTPVVGLWPPLVRRLARPATLAPMAVEPEETCPSGFALADMVAVLAACTVEPPRLRSNDLTLFARAVDTLAALLTPLPEWIEKTFAASRTQRVEQAAWLLSRLDFLEIVRDEERRPQLAATDAGRKWLTLAAKERWKRLLDEIKKPARRSARVSDLTFIPQDWSLSAPSDFDETAMTVAAFEDLGPGVFYDLGDFLSHRSQIRNPLVELSRSGKRYYWLPGTPEQRERVWARRLLSFLQERLLRVGGIRLGRSGDRIGFALTDVGLYLLGLGNDFEVAAERPAEVVVQPNFDVVFLSPSITTEAAIARFAERRGTGVGTLFRITKRAVLGAAATGLTAEQALATLRQAAAKGVPDNVAREIAGWFGQTRRITVRPAVLVHCPDVEAARRVLAAGGKSVTPLTDTVVELKEPKGKAALLRKLREVGVFLGE